MISPSFSAINSLYFLAGLADSTPKATAAGVVTM